MSSCFMINSKRDTPSQIDVSVVLRKSKKILSSDPQRSLDIIVSFLETKKLSLAEKADLIAQRAEAKRMLGDYKGAIVDLELSLPVYQQNNQDDKIALIMHRIGTCYIYTLEYKKSHAYLHKALEIREGWQDKIPATKT